MRLAYLGTPSAAVPPLVALIEAGHDVQIVVSQPDRRRGRGSDLQPSPVKAKALELGLEVTDRVDEVLDRGLDLGVVVAFGRVLKPHVLEELPMVNLHFSLLPRWRGAAPVERAILAGDSVTGVCLMEVTEGLDEGGVYRRVEVPIGGYETVGDLRDRLVGIGSRVLVDALEEGLGVAEHQRGEVTYASKIQPAELHLDWSEPVSTCLGRIRIGRAWTMWRGKRFLVHRARAVCQREGSAPADRLAVEPGTLDGVRVLAGDGWIELQVVQPEGKARQEAAAWHRGAHPRLGELLGR